MGEVGLNKVRTVERRGQFNSRRDVYLAKDNMPVWWDIAPGDESGFHTNWRIRHVGPVTLIENSTGACVGRRRSAELSDEDGQFICLTVTLQGRLLARQDGRELFLEAGDIYLWDKGNPIFTETFDHATTRTMWVDKTRLLRYLLHSDIGMQKIDRRNPMVPMLHYQLNEIHQVADRLDRLQLSRITNSIVETLSGCLPQAEPQMSSSDTVFQLVVESIENRLDDIDLSIGSLANELNISDRTIRRACSAKSTTFSTMLRERRLDHVRDLLTRPEAPNLSLTNVAIEYGFYDLPHFSREFKRRFGTSPNAFRKGLI